jgi:hypothetical protein
VRTAVAFVAVLTAAEPVYAQSAPLPGDTAMQHARSAWDSGDFDLAPGLYQAALNAGGLKRNDVLEAYVRMGCALAASNKIKPSLAALRHAALLDPNFTVPPEAGKKAIAVAIKARREQKRVGSLTLSAQVPDEVASGEAFGVDVSLGSVKNSPVDTISVEARDSLSARSFKHSTFADARVHFEVPARMTLPDASLVIAVSAVDSHENELATFERHIHVKHAAPPPPPPIVAVLRPQPEHPRSKTTKSTSSGGGFWHTAWPYIIGGTVLAAGGAAIYVGTRPTSDVYVQRASVLLAHF